MFADNIIMGICNPKAKKNSLVLSLLLLDNTNKCFSSCKQFHLDNFRPNPTINSRG